jgi:hypothetical protein
MEKSENRGAEMPNVDIAVAAGKEDSISGIEIPTPAGFEAPEDAAKGGSFDVLATVKMEGGKLMLEAIDGLPVDGAIAEAEADLEVETEEVPEAEMEPSLEAEQAPAGGDADFMAAIERSFSKKKK